MPEPTYSRPEANPNAPKGTYGKGEPARPTAPPPTHARPEANPASPAGTYGGGEPTRREASVGGGGAAPPPTEYAPVAARTSPTGSPTLRALAGVTGKEFKDPVRQGRFESYVHRVQEKKGTPLSAKAWHENYWKTNKHTEKGILPQYNRQLAGYEHASNMTEEERKQLEALSGKGDYQLPAPTGRMVTFQAFGGKNITVDSSLEEPIKRISAKWEAKGGESWYPITDIGGVGTRGSASYHPEGLAVDLNVAKNPNTESDFITDMPPEFVAFWLEEGFGWGGFWNTEKDTMHFSAGNSEGANGGHAKYLRGGTDPRQVPEPHEVNVMSVHAAMEAEKRGIAPGVMLGLINNENPWYDMGRKGASGGVGIAQVRPDKAAAAADLSLPNWQKDPLQNITLGAEILSRNIGESGSVEGGLTAYAGPDAAAAAAGEPVGGETFNAPPDAVALAKKYGGEYGVDPGLLLAIGKHETGFGELGAGRNGYDLGYGATDSGQIPKYAGRENQYREAAAGLARRGVHSLEDVQAGKASWYATDPGWEAGIARAYSGVTSGGGTAGAAPNGYVQQVMDFAGKVGWGGRVAGGGVSPSSGGGGYVGVGAGGGTGGGGGYIDSGGGLPGNVNEALNMAGQQDEDPENDIAAQATDPADALTLGPNEALGVRSAFDVSLDDQAQGVPAGEPGQSFSATPDGGQPTGQPGALPTDQPSQVLGNDMDLGGLSMMAATAGRDPREDIWLMYQLFAGRSPTQEELSHWLTISHKTSGKARQRIAEHRRSMGLE